jgi:hypothetical protein
LDGTLVGPASETLHIKATFNDSGLFMVVARRPTGKHDAPAAIKRIGANAMADIFISYTAADRDWAFWIAKELEALGHRRSRQVLRAPGADPLSRT